MATLNRAAKLFIVERLACYDSPTDVVKAVKAELGIDVSRQQVWYYDASHPLTRQRMSEDLVAVFDMVRENFNADLGAIPIANTAYRLRKLQQLVDGLLDGTLKVPAPLIASLLEQAAKERGGAFTNRRELTGAGGGPIKTEASPYDLSKLTDEQLAELERLVAAAESAPEPSAG
ncbi:MAG: DUF2280 domain-containing protein [Fimbriimonas sp.]